MSRLYYDYLRICKGRECVIRRRIDAENDRRRVRRMFKEYCSTCVLGKIMVKELRRGGKI
jgi:hypothetical protein